MNARCAQKILASSYLIITYKNLSNSLLNFLYVNFLQCYRDSSMSLFLSEILQISYVLSIHFPREIYSEDDILCKQKSSVDTTLKIVNLNICLGRSSTKINMTFSKET